MVMLVFLLVMVGVAVVRSLVEERFHFFGSRHTQLVVVRAGDTRQNHQIARPKD